MKNPSKKVKTSKKKKIRARNHRSRKKTKNLDRVKKATKNRSRKKAKQNRSRKKAKQNRSRKKATNRVQGQNRGPNLDQVRAMKVASQN